MGVCSYCLTYQRDECFGWPEARACAGITGPDDPKRLARKVEMKRREARDARSEADRIEREAAEKVGRLRTQAARLDVEAAEIEAGLPAPAPAD